MKPRLLAEPSPLMRSTVTRTAESIAMMVVDCGIPMHEFAMHVDIGTKTGPRPGVPAIYVSADGNFDPNRDDIVRIAPMPFDGFRGMATDGSPLLKALLKTRGKDPTDLVIACTDHNLNTGFVGYARGDFGLPVTGHQVVRSNTPKHIREAQSLAAVALNGLDPKTASAAIHGGTAWEKMTKARRIAGADWPAIEDTVSTALLAFGTPTAWGDLIANLAREKTRYGMWWLDAHDEHPAGIAFVVQDPSEAAAAACLKGGMVAHDWTTSSTPNGTLGKRLVPGSTAYVWYADEFFAAADAAEKAKGS